MARRKRRTHHRVRKVTRKDVRKWDKNLKRAREAKRATTNFKKCAEQMKRKAKLGRKVTAHDKAVYKRNLKKARAALRRARR